MPWMPPIWIREIVSEGGTLRDRMLRLPREAVNALGDMLARGSGGARFPGHRPRLAFLTLAGVVMLPLATVDCGPHSGNGLTNAVWRHALTVLQRAWRHPCAPRESDERHRKRPVRGAALRDRARRARQVTTAGMRGYVEGEFVHVSSPTPAAWSAAGEAGRSDRGRRTPVRSRPSTRPPRCQAQGN
jgi:hypothetical protein